MEPATITRLHRGSGLVLLAYLFFHAWEHWPAREGRGPALERLRHSTNLAAELSLLATAFGLHAWAATRRARRSTQSEQPWARPFRRMEAASGLLALAFLLVHAAGVWLPRLGSGTNELALAAMQAQSGTLPGLVMCVLGLASVCTYAGLGMVATLADRGKLGRGLAIALAVMLYLLFVNELSAYATGASLL